MTKKHYFWWVAVMHYVFGCLGGLFNIPMAHILAMLGLGTLAALLSIGAPEKRKR